MQLLSSVPGLEVYLASSPVMAHKLLKKAISSSSPSLFLEPRWLYKTQQEIEPKDEAQEAIEGAAEVLHGGDVAILTYGEGVVEALKASDLFPNDSFYLIDFHSLHIGLPEGIIAKIRSIGRCVIFDSYCTSGGPLVEVALGLAQRGVQIDIIRPPHVPVPTATSLSSSYYPNHQDLARCLAAALGAPLAFSELAFEELHLPPTLRLSKTWKIDRS